MYSSEFPLLSFRLLRSWPQASALIFSVMKFAKYNLFLVNQSIINPLMFRYLHNTEARFPEIFLLQT